MRRLDENEKHVVMFRQVSHWLAPAALELCNETDRIPSEELIVAVMGVNAIQRRDGKRNAFIGINH